MVHELNFLTAWTYSSINQHLCFWRRLQETHSDGQKQKAPNIRMKAYSNLHSKFFIVSTSGNKYFTCLPSFTLQCTISPYFECIGFYAAVLLPDICMCFARKDYSHCIVATLNSLSYAVKWMKNNVAINCLKCIVFSLYW